MLVLIYCFPRFQKLKILPLLLSCISIIKVVPTVSLVLLSFNEACSSRVFSGAEETAPVEAVSEDDSQEERERKERIPQRKADISRCWSKYCMDVLRASREKCVQELTSADQSEEEQNSEKGLKSFFF